MPNILAMNKLKFAVAHTLLHIFAKISCTGVKAYQRIGLEVAPRTGWPKPAQQFL